MGRIEPDDAYRSRILSSLPRDHADWYAATVCAGEGLDAVGLRNGIEREKSEIDWRYLLHAYIQHVGFQEGTSFVDRLRECNREEFPSGGALNLTESEPNFIEALDQEPFVGRKTRP